MQKNEDLARKILLGSSAVDGRSSHVMINLDELFRVEHVGVSRPSRFGE